MYLCILLLHLQFSLCYSFLELISWLLTQDHVSLFNHFLFYSINRKRNAIVKDKTFVSKLTQTLPIQLGVMIWKKQLSIKRLMPRKQKLSWRINCRFVLTEVFLEKGVLKIFSKFTGEHPCLCNFLEITLWHGCFLVNLLHIFRTLFLKNTLGWLLLCINFVPGTFLIYSI